MHRPMRAFALATLMAAATAAPAFAQSPDMLKPGITGPISPSTPGNLNQQFGGPRPFNPGNNGFRGGGGPGRFQGGNPGAFRGGGRFGDNGGFRGNRGYYRHHYGSGAAIGAGVAGLAAGALIGGAIANQGYGAAPYADGGYDVDAYDAPPPPVPAGGDEEAYCASRYRSYDPASGTYLGYDGERHPCP